METFRYGEDHLTADVALAIAEGSVKGILSSEVRERICQSARIVSYIANSDEAIYGINTGFGPLCTTRISPEETIRLQENILMSHAVGVGEPISETLSRLMMILKVQSLAQGYSGVQEGTLDRIIWFLDQELTPVVPSQGSVGASGDLAPLAHLFLPLIGQGKVYYGGQERFTSEVYQELGTAPIQLAPKEGLALINGTQFIAAHAVMTVHRMRNLIDSANIIGAMMLEALLASVKPFSPELHALRPYKGNQEVASTIRSLLAGSQVIKSHEYCDRVQDPYSLRCIPQVHGASLNAWYHLKELLEVELNSVTDNPIIFDEEHTVSGGNFHGQPLALTLDYACMACSEIGNISDRRIYLSLEGNTPHVPKLLLSKTGTNSGFMIPQYTSAALVSENKGLCFPSSVDSIPTSLGQEDHVSMGSISSRKVLKVIENAEKVLAIEYLCAAQALDYHRPLKSSPPIAAIHRLIRLEVPHIEVDQLLQGFIERAIKLVHSGALPRIAFNKLNQMVS
ncbi:histidine ammonia-lyase [Marinoscillum sp. MHG1-6]|uniref:histidine ammonia-lyase n=1 Tax=Marinoscillum sp. MHG1-6 TaxID=2959627 RepID=UPI002157BD36|nr:histidine ammonia-lyase [Marinoscillum sp. MHG1-6]